MGAFKILVDTSVLIDYSKNFGEVLEELLGEQARGKVQLVVNTVIVAEFMTDQNLKDKRWMEKSMQFMGLFQVVEMGRKEGLLAGEILRQRECLSVPDALIAATCLAHNMVLLTRNTKHFVKVPGLELYAQG